MTPPGSTPVVHLTDLYTPPQDPDDTLDLVTLHALPELDIRAVVLDPTRQFLRARRDGGHDIAREPGLGSVLQLQHLTGTAYPVATGPADPLRGPSDDCRDRGAGEQAGVELILRVLRDSDAPVVVSVVSSLRPLVAAYNREPALCHEKIDRVLVNAGSSAPGSDTEWNVTLDPHAYAAIWATGLPVHWYPCAGAGGSFATEENNTYWSASRARLLTDLAAPLRAWLHYAFGSSGRGDLLRSLHELGEGDAWTMMLEGERNMWSTASLVDTADRRLTPTAGGWRFVPVAEASTESLTSTEPVLVEVDDRGTPSWTPSDRSPTRLFRRRLAIDHDAAMTEALHGLLVELVVDPALG